LIDEALALFAPRRIQIIYILFGVLLKKNWSNISPNNSYLAKLYWIYFKRMPSFQACIWLHFPLRYFASYFINTRIFGFMLILCCASTATAIGERDQGNLGILLWRQTNCCVPITWVLHTNKSLKQKKNVLRRIDICMWFHQCLFARN